MQERAGPGSALGMWRVVYRLSKGIVNMSASKILGWGRGIPESAQGFLLYSVLRITTERVWGT